MIDRRGRADAWLRHVSAARRPSSSTRGIAPELEAEILQYFVGAADFMVNAR